MGINIEVDQAAAVGVYDLLCPKRPWVKHVDLCG